MTALEDETPPLSHPPKADPESLVLRGRPRPVARFRRGVVIGGIAAVSAALVALTWIALEPVTFRTVAGDPGGRPFERSSPEAVEGAPRDYQDIPKLGPPLPGDLGRPIVEQQREQTEASLQSAKPVAEVSSDRAAAMREQRGAAEQAARASSVVVQLSGGKQQPVSDRSAPDQQQAQATSVAGNDRVRLGDWSRGQANQDLITAPVSRWVISAGSVIPASLLTGLNSDLPGMVLAQVTENVRDSVTGREILIPQGARLIGRYDSDLSFGQKRAFVVWQRILFPDGSSLRLDNMPASDAEGYAGFSDRVDGHSWQLIKGVLLSSILGVGSELSLGSDRGLLRALRQSVQQNGSQAGEQIVSKALNIQPTIRVRPGWPVRVLVSEDLILPPWKG